MIKFKGGYRYQLVDDYRIKLERVRSSKQIVTNRSWVRLQKSGWLELKAGYCWDGASGPAIDTKRIMRGSLVHDALYQLLRSEYLAPECRKQADEELRRICLEDGMSKVMAFLVYWSVRIFGKPASVGKKPVMEAP